MKVLVFTTNFPLLDGGVAPYSYELAKGFTQAGYDVLVLTQRFTEEDAAFDLQQEFKIIRVNRMRLKIGDMLYLFCQLIRVLATFRPSVVFATAWLPCGLLMYPFARLFSIRMITTAYALEIIAPQRRKWTKYIMLKVLRTSSVIVAISQYTRNVLLQLGINERDIVIIPVGIDPEKFPLVSSMELREKYKLTDKRVILTLARVIQRKGQDYVLRSLPEVIKLFPNVVYLIAGKGAYEPELKKLAQELGVEKHVIFVGYVPNEDIPAIYQLCDLYIMPSRELKEEGDAEGFGITFLEANICGKPVIGGRSGGVIDAIVQEKTGLLVDPENVQEISQAIIMLLSNPELSWQMGQNGRIRAAQEFNWKSIITRHIDLLTSQANDDK